MAPVNCSSGPKDSSFVVVSSVAAVELRTDLRTWTKLSGREDATKTRPVTVDFLKLLG